MPISSGGHANFAVIVLVNFYFLILKIKLWQKIKNLKEGKVTTVTQVEAAVEIRVKTAAAAANHPKGKISSDRDSKGSTSSSGGGRTSQSGGSGDSDRER